MGVLGKDVEYRMAALEGLVEGAGGVLSDAVRDAAAKALEAIAKVDERLRPLMPQANGDAHDDAYNEGRNQAAYIEVYGNSLSPKMLLDAVKKYHNLVKKYISPNSQS